ncbi:helix-turn-helix transcriptional regulator [Variovorax sp. CCNWLW186]|jgi:transcriptional regulator with XRE-family HTH domain|uniref:helix-turn-helix domain-containing protein n=1 Tax=Variovorax sp. CCNWLW186 TaxID=3127473 RepID=UPI003077B281
MTNLGKELRKIRLDLGITLYEMAAQIGISSGMLSSIETGKKPAPANFVERLASEYEQVAKQVATFHRLADLTKSEVRVSLDGRQNANELAVAFARNFDKLSDSEINRLMAVFEKKE